MIIDLVRKAREIGVRYTERDNIDNETVRHLRALRNVNEAPIEGLKTAFEGGIYA